MDGSELKREKERKDGGSSTVARSDSELSPSFQTSSFAKMGKTSRSQSPFNAYTHTERENVCVCEWRRFHPCAACFVGIRPFPATRSLAHIRSRYCLLSHTRTLSVFSSSSKDKKH